MALTTKQILDKIEIDLSSQNKFNFNIAIPSILSQSITSETISFYVKSLSLPSINLNLTETKYLGRAKYAVTSANVDSVNVIFYDTKKQDLRKLWVNYVELISMNSKSSVLKHYPSEYQTKGTITIHETTWEIEGATPINVGDFMLDYDSTNTLGMFNVGFKVKSVR